MGKFAAPYDLGIDRAGNIYVINTTCKQVLKFSPGFGELLANLDVRIGVDYPRPHGLAAPGRRQAARAARACACADGDEPDPHPYVSRPGDAAGCRDANAHRRCAGCARRAP